jgi:hypothetical protein
LRLSYTRISRARRPGHSQGSASAAAAAAAAAATMAPSLGGFFLWRPSQDDLRALEAKMPK